MKKLDRFTAFCITFGPALILTGCTAFAAIGGTMLFAALVLALYKLEFITPERERENAKYSWFCLKWQLCSKLRRVWGTNGRGKRRAMNVEYIKMCQQQMKADREFKQRSKFRRAAWYIGNAIWVIIAILIILGVFIIAETIIQAFDPYTVNHFSPLTAWFWKVTLKMEG